MKKISFIVSLIMSACLICSCETDRYIVFGGFAQGGQYSVKANIKGVRVAPELIKSKVDSILNEIDFTLSGYNKASLLSRFNAGEQIIPNAMFVDLYATSYRFWEMSSGAFDTAAGPLFDIWGFGFTQNEMPDDATVSQALQNCGTARLKHPSEAFCVGRPVQNTDILLAPAGSAPRLNYNAIAQGYSCDVVASYLRSIGVKDMLVDIGEIFCDGFNPSGKGWTIGIDNPVDGNMDPGADIKGTWKSDGQEHGVVTSGNYRKFYVKDGKKYSHTIDPRTGYPVSHNLLSATVIAPDATTADALATYCMVIGLDAAKAFVEAHPELEACLISDDGIWYSEGF